MKTQKSARSGLNLFLATAMAAMLAGGVALHAATITWDGGTAGNGTDWGSSADWQYDTLPGGTDSVLFISTNGNSGGGVSTTNGSAIITNVNGVANYQVGQTITGTNLPAGTTILAILSPSSLLLSQNATATASNNNLTIVNSGGLASSPTISLGASRTIYALNQNATTSSFTIGSAADILAGYTLTLTNVTRTSFVNQPMTIAAGVVLAPNLTGRSTWYSDANASSTFTVTGGISSSGSVVLVRGGLGGTITMNGANTFTGSLLVEGGTLSLGGTNAYTGTTTASGGTLTVNFNAGATATPATDIINSASGLALGGVRGGGTVTVNGKNAASSVNSQTFAGTTLNAGASTFNIVNGISSGKTLVNLGAISRNAGGTVNFVQPTVNTAIGAQNGYTTTTANDASGILGAYATVGGNDWATNNGTNIVAYTGYAADTWGAGTNTNVTTGGTVANDSTTNSLRFNTAGAATLTLGGTNTISSGGILVGSTVGNNLTTITGGTLQGASGGELIIHQNNSSNSLTIASNITDNTTATALTKSGGGNLNLTGTLSYTGGTYVNAGTLTLVAGSTNPLATTGSINVTGGTLALGTGTTQTTSGAIILASGTLSGGTLTNTGSAYDVRNGTISSVLAGSVGLNKTTSGTVTFSNATSNTFTGDTVISEGSVVGGSAASVLAISGNLIVGSANGGNSASYSNSGNNVAFNSSKNVTVYSNGSINFGGGAQNLNGTVTIIGGSISGSQVYQNVAVNMTGGTWGATSYGNVQSFTSFASADTAVVSGYLAGSQSTRTFTVADGAAAVDLLFSSGTAVNTNNLTKTGAGLMVMTGNAKSYTGTTTVNQGTLVLDFSGSGAPTTNLISASSAVSLSDATLKIIGKASTTNSQTFASTTITGGASTIAIMNDAASNDTLVNLGALTRTGGVINLVQPVNGAVSATNGYTTTTSNDATGILGAWATVGGTDWASNNGTNVVAYTGYADLSGGTPGILDGSTTNVRVTSGSTGDIGQASGTVTVNTLNANDATARVITVGAGNTLRLGLTGGILSSGTGGLTIGASGNAGTLTAGGANNTASTLILNNTSGSALAVNSVIANNGTGAVTLLKTGTGTTTLAGTNTFTGGANIYQGTLSIAANAALGLQSTGAALTLDGGTLQTTANVGLYNGTIGTNNRNVTLGTAGGTFDTATGTTLTVAGVVSGSGTLTKTGAGAIALTNANTNTGVTTIGAGTLQLGNGGTTGKLAVGTTIVDNGDLAINRSNAVTQGTDFSTGAISGTGTFTQAGSGTTTLNAANTYTGATRVNAGTLAVGSLANGGASSTIGASTNAASNLVLNGGTFQYTGAAASTDRLFSVGTVGASVLDASGSGAINFTNTGAMGFNSQTGTRTLTLTGTNAGANTLAAIIADNGGATSVTKTGAGQWVVTGASTYTGGLTVSAGTMATGATGTFGGGNITFTSGTLTLGNAASIADGATLSFASLNIPTINLSFVGTEVLFGLTDASQGGLSIGDGTYSADDLNNFFGSIIFLGTGYLAVGAIPEPSTYAAIFGALVLAGVVCKRRRRD